MGSITPRQHVPFSDEPVNGLPNLPHLRKQPPFELLIQVLEALKVRPSSWVKPAVRQKIQTQEATVSRYLLTIISNSLDWFEDSMDADCAMAKKEYIWELTSRRIAERCGRSAMPEMNRSWVIPVSDNLPEMKFEIREPPLTGDNLGLKTWGTAYAIAKKLEFIRHQHFSHLLDGDQTSTTKVLELGAGTGLVGIAAAAIWSTHIILTDLEEIQSNLSHNIKSNESVIVKRGGRASGETLNWKSSEDAFADCSNQEFDIIIAADSLYDDEHPELVAAMIKKYLVPDLKSRAFVAVPMRDHKTKGMALQLQQSLQAKGFRLLHQGEEICRDDWEGGEEDEEVKCWWGISGFAIPVPMTTR